jgi:hypothetical protein
LNEANAVDIGLHTGHLPVPNRAQSKRYALLALPIGRSQLYGGEGNAVLAAVLPLAEQLLERDHRQHRKEQQPSRAAGLLLHALLQLHPRLRDRLALGSVAGSIHQHQSAGDLHRGQQQHQHFGLPQQGQL